MIYFDNAATTFQKPESVYRGVEKAMRCLSANPGRSGHELSMSAAETVFETRRQASEFFHLKDCERVIFTANCTMSLNLAIKGLLKRGDHALVSCFDHNSSLRPLESLKRSGIIEYEVFEVFPQDAGKTLKDIEKRIKPNTKALICTHVSNAFGTVLPIDEIGQLLKRYGIYFILDAAQSAGVFDIDVNKLNIDVLCLPCHKGLYATMGTGMLLWNCEKQPETLLEGGTGSLSSSLSQPDFFPDILESGTLNVPGIAGIKAGIEFIQERKIANIYKHEKEITDYICKEIQKLDSVIVYRDSDLCTHCAPLLSFNIDSYSSDTVSDRLSKAGIAVRSGLHCAPLAHRAMGTFPLGTVRVSPGIFNDFCEAEELIRIVKKICINGL